MRQIQFRARDYILRSHVRFPGIVVKEVLKENSEVAIKALEAQREAIEARITQTSKPLNAEIDKINKRIESLKGMVGKDENV